MWLPVSLQHLKIKHSRLDDPGLQQAFSRFTHLKTLRLGFFLTTETVEVLSHACFPHLHTFGFDLPFYASWQDLIVYDEYDDEEDCTNLEVSSDMVKLSHVLPAVEVFEVWSSSYGGSAQDVLHILDCSWMDQRIFAKLRGVTNRCEHRYLHFGSVPATCFVADLGC